MRRHNTAIPPDFFRFRLGESLRSLLRNRFLVAENEERGVTSCENTVDVFERAARGFGVEEVYW